jgi:hypothetical protein
MVETIEKETKGTTLPEGETLHKGPTSRQQVQIALEQVIKRMNAQILTKRIQESNEDIVLPFQEKEWIEQRKMNYTTLKPYRGWNVPLLSYVPCDLFITKSNAEKDYNATLKPNATPYVVVAWFPKPKRKGETDEEYKKRTGFWGWTYRAFTVYPITDVEGLPVKELSVDKLSKNKRNESADQFIERVLNKFGIKKVEGGNRTYYNVLDNTITIPLITRFVSENNYYIDLFKEIISATGMPTILKRYKDNDTKDEDYSKEQLVVEIGSAGLCHIFGMDVPKSSAFHVDKWMQTLDAEPEILLSASSLAEKAIDYLFKEEKKKDEKKKPKKK